MIDLPVGTTAQRPGSPSTGALRYNSTSNKFEGYDNNGWLDIGSGGGSGGATGGGSDTVFQENSLTVTTSYSISSNKSAMSVGPLTLNSGVVITIPANARWVIL